MENKYKSINNKKNVIIMLGKPKYDYGDIVTFKIGNDIREGSIYIIDRYGTFGDDSDVSYDIMVQLKEGDKYYTEGGNNECLFKHINEKYVIGKVK